MKLHICDISSMSTLSVKKCDIQRKLYNLQLEIFQYKFIGLHVSQALTKRKNQLVLKVENNVRGSFFMFVESGCISTNIEFTVP